jgi:hypothetical protein
MVWYHCRRGRKLSKDSWLHLSIKGNRNGCWENHTYKAQAQRAWLGLWLCHGTKEPPPHHYCDPSTADKEHTRFREGAKPHEGPPTCGRRSFWPCGKLNTEKHLEAHQALWETQSNLSPSLEELEVCDALMIAKYQQNWNTAWLLTRLTQLLTLMA